MTMRGSLSIVSCLSCLFASAYSWGATNYVATTGNDTNAGTLGAPWRTVQKAANTLAPGDTVLVRGGVYSERVTVNISGSAGAGYVTFRSYPGETAVLDGTGVAVPSTDNGLFLIVDRAYISIQGFELRNYKTNSSSRVPAGIFVSGACHHISVISNAVHNIENNSASGNGFGIAFYGTSSSQPISNVVVLGNEVYSLKTGSSESVVLNGNVTGFEVSGNFVHDNNNIGIDFIGFEGTCPDPAQDRARNGFCRSNFVWNISSYGNPAYGNSYGADGIYCDGATNVVIERNQVYATDIAVELATEHSNRTCSSVILRDNFIWSNRVGGIFIGGYDAKRGRTEFCDIHHNTLFHNDTLQQGNGEFYLQFDTRSNSFTHNLVVANSQNLLIGNPWTQNTNNLLDWNLYFAPGGAGSAEWQWKNVSRVGFAVYQAATGNDANSIFADPLLVSTGTPDLHLTTNSPALNRGNPAFAPAADERDMDGQPRAAGGRVDIGADEWLPAHFDPPVLLPGPRTNGSFHLRLQGQPNAIYELQGTSDFAQWSSLATNSTPTGIWDWQEPATNLERRFFRAVTGVF
jgi:hypothetical protein